MQPHESHSIMERWRRKFACALRGLVVGIRGQNSFTIHFPVTLAVLAVATWLNVSSVEWAVLGLCITCVIAAELFNSALEHLAKSITKEQHPEIRDALDVASGAVLVASVGAAFVGLIVLARPVVERLVGF